MTIYWARDSRFGLLLRHCFMGPTPQVFIGPVNNLMPIYKILLYFIIFFSSETPEYIYNSFSCLFKSKYCLFSWMIAGYYYNLLFFSWLFALELNPREMLTTFCFEIYILISSSNRVEKYYDGGLTFCHPTCKIFF